MVIRIQSVLLLMCLTVLLVAHVEGRWHNLRMLRKQQHHRAVHDTGEEDRDLKKSLLADGDYDSESEESEDSQTQYVRHRRHHQLDMENEEQQQETEDQGLPKHRFLDRRRHRNHPQMKRLRHHQHRHPRHHLESTDSDPLDITREQNEDDYDSTANRDKRNYYRKPWTDKDRKSFKISRTRPAVHYEDEKTFEVEVREAQNSSLCNYTVIPIPDPGGRIPRDLEHVKCNHAGSKCQDKGTYCCIQTYRQVEVVYASGTTEILKVYSGCVCSLQVYGTLEPYIPHVDVDD